MVKSVTEKKEESPVTNKLLKAITTKSSKRRGRGYGSGRGGHTVGRGMKGQKSRRKIGILFEGVKMKKSFIKRLPLRRGKGKFKASSKPLVIKLNYLNLLPADSKVDIDLLVKQNIINAKDAKSYGVKILGDGEITKKLTILVPISKSATKKVEKAGGKVIRQESRENKKTNEKKKDK